MADKRVSENRIGSERVRMRMSQVVLARELEISNKTLCAWEMGRSQCPNEFIVKLSKFFGCTTDYLLGASLERLPRQSA